MIDLRNKNWFIVISAIICIFALGACGKANDSEQENNEQMQKFFVSNVSDYEIVDESANESGVYTVVVSAPDFAEILNNYYSGNSAGDGQKIDVDTLEQIVNESSDKMKQYTFSVESTDEKDVKNAFLDQIAYDLIINAIENIQYTEEEWETEE